VAEELGQLHGHRARGGGVDRCQRADRIQAVEQKVRIDLGAQHAQLGVLGHQLHLQALGLELRTRSDSISR
jgi:hypothetical protein